MIHYIGWYVDLDHDGVYYGNIPAKLKMRYVADKVLAAGKKLTVFSLANRSSKGIYFTKKHKATNGINIRYSAGFSQKGKIGKTLNSFIKKLEFVYYIIFKVKKQDTIILYHSVAYTKTLSFLKKFFNRKTVLEVEELYGFSAQGDDQKCLKTEFKSIKKMDYFILINDYMQSELGISADKYVSCYGVVSIPERKVNRKQDGKIHVVYAGTIEGRKMGAYTAAEVSQYLPSEYFVHILGFGKKENIDLLCKKIDEINSKRKEPVIKYEGFKQGSELDDFLHTCHIGLSPYVMRETFSNNSFPSKIFSYMCHDLTVVRGYAKAYENMDISKNWSVYYDQSPECIASAVRNAVITEQGAAKETLMKYDVKLINFIKKVC